MDIPFRGKEVVDAPQGIEVHGQHKKDKKCKYDQGPHEIVFKGMFSILLPQINKKFLSLVRKDS
jgi:hypothetical protein